MICIVFVIRYARENFDQFEQQRSLEIARLMGALAFCGNLGNSPYEEFTNEDVWQEMTESFRKVYCDGARFLNDTSFAQAAAPESSVSKILQRERPGSPTRYPHSSPGSSRASLLANSVPELTDLSPFA